MTDYSNPVVIGGGYKTLASQIYVQAIGNYKLQVGTSVAVILLAVTVVVFLVQRYLMRSKNYVALTGKASRERQLITEKRVALPINAICFLLTLCILLFYVFLILGGFFKSWGVDYSFSLDSFKYVISYTGKAIKDTTLIALTASPISAVLAMAGCLPCGTQAVLWAPVFGAVLVARFGGSGNGLWPGLHSCIQ